jgi:hypothetical protein
MQADRCCEVPCAFAVTGRIANVRKQATTIHANFTDPIFIHTLLLAEMPVAEALQ